MEPFRLTTRNEGTRARLGSLRTGHGTLETPLFLPVATKATVKALSPEETLATGSTALIANSFHLHLEPGEEVVESAGGLNGFMKWKGAIFTDSGGFQLIRKEFGLKRTDEGFHFRYADGTPELFTPAKSMEVQMRLGSDVAMTLDDCPPYGASARSVLESLERTTRWAKRCRLAHDRKDQLLFGIVQGGTSVELRRRSASELVAMDFDGYGIGGLTIGEPKAEMFSTVGGFIDLIPENRPRYLMGLGSPLDMLRAVALGVDIFDSVFPTRYGRHGTVFTFRGKYDIRRAQFKGDRSPLEEGCACASCAGHSRSYVRHLLRAKEMLGLRLMSIHNLHFTQELMGRARVAIKEGSLERLMGEVGAHYGD